MYQLSYIDSFDQRVTLKFNNPSINKVPLRKFKVLIPKDTDVVSYKNILQ